MFLSLAAASSSSRSSIPGSPPLMLQQATYGDMSESSCPNAKDDDRDFDSDAKRNEVGATDFDVSRAFLFNEVIYNVYMKFLRRML